jgi:hypothetical protein
MIGESIAHVASFDEYSIQSTSSDSTVDGDANTISEHESWLQQDFRFSFPGPSIESPFVDESLSISIPASQLQRAMLPSNITPSE